MAVLGRQDPVGAAVRQDMTRYRDAKRRLVALTTVGGQKRLLQLAAVCGQQQLVAMPPHDQRASGGDQRGSDHPRDDPRTPCST